MNLDRIREGDVTALHYFRPVRHISVTNRNYDIRSPHFGEPEWYRVHPAHASGPFTVHRTRVLRFDGIRPPTKSGFTIYDQDFGVSILVPIIVTLLEDQTLASAVAHMSQEASIPVMNIAGLREAIAGGGDPDEATPEQIGAEINRMKSIYRLLMLDEPGRENVFAGASGVRRIGRTYEYNAGAGGGGAEDTVHAVYGQPAQGHERDWRKRPGQLHPDDGGQP